MAATVSVKLEPEDPPQQGAPSPPPPVETAGGSVAAAAPLADVKHEVSQHVRRCVSSQTDLHPRKWSRCQGTWGRLSASSFGRCWREASTLWHRSPANCKCTRSGVHQVHSAASRSQPPRLLQGTLSRGHPLGTAAVTESLVEEAVVGVGAIEVGQPCGIRLFALPRSLCPADKVSHSLHTLHTMTGTVWPQFRSVVLKLFQSHRWLRRKTLLEEMERECGQQPEPKELSAVLKVIIPTT